MKKTVKFTLDTAQPAPLSKAQKASLKALQAMPDKEIDFSDAPKMNDAFWQNAEPNSFFRSTKNPAACGLIQL
jgi:hypothetical protein